jgi:(p)ppGpp synthase/HD superfamily hydrolase
MKLRETDPGAGSNIPLAFHLVEEGHAGQLRRSGEKYKNHPISVAEIVVHEWGMGEEEAVAALCHDMREDARIKGQPITKKFLREYFGKRVASLVEGVTELGKEPEFSGNKPSLVEIFGKWLEFGSKDLAIFLIKLADRLHNMRTLVYMKEKKRIAKAHETLHVFGKVADILGMWELKRELEDLSFQYLGRAAGFDYSYQEIADVRWKVFSDSREKILDIVDNLRSKISSIGIEADVQMEVRSIYELYQRMEKRNLSLNNILPTDIWRINIVAPGKYDCYTILGRVHDIFHPIQEEMRDFIADPQPNEHRFLHTYVQVPGFGRLLVQVRSQEMNDNYRRGILTKIEADKDWHMRGRAWLDALTEYLRGTGVTEDALYGMFDAVSSSIYVYLREGERIELPYGATPLDLAARISGKTFMRLEKVYINGRPVPLSQMLRDGDEVVIVRKKKARPALEWIDWVRRTPWDSRVLKKFRRFLKKKNRQNILRSAFQYLNTKTMKYHLPAERLFNTEFIKSVLAGIGYSDVDQFIYEVGIGEISADHFLAIAQEKILQELNNPDRKKRLTGVKIMGNDRPGLLDDITNKLRRQGINMASGEFFKYKEDTKDLAEIRLAIEIMPGLVGAVQKLQIDTIVKSVEGVTKALPLPQEELERHSSRGERGKRGRKKKRW